MATVYSCNTSTISPYIPTPENPWNDAKIKHLYRRLAYGATITELENAKSKSPAQLVDELIDAAMAQNATPAPEWGYWTDVDYGIADEDLLREEKNKKRDEGYAIATKDLLNNGLHGRLTFFWLNHFVTQYGEYNCPAYMYQYYIKLQEHAIGNFKEFTREIGLTAAMLAFLNNFENTKRRPNENYARELFELFTLGEDIGYTQDDIEEASRAMTGYNSRDEVCGPISFDPETFDTGTKTIFDRTGNWDYDDVIEILFEERRDTIAELICAKLYRYFVNPEQDANIIVQMKKTFLENDFDIAPVLRQLFKSEHFFDTNTHGIIIKSPYDVTLQFLHESGLSYTDELLERLQNMNSTLSQNFFHPVDVAGWQRNRKWLNTNTLPTRWFFLEELLWKIWGKQIEMTNPDENIPSGHNKEAYRDFVIALVGSDTKDVTAISKQVVDFFISKELVSPMEYEAAEDAFKGEFADNYFEPGPPEWNLSFDEVPDQVRKLLRHIVEMPEFQLK